MNLKTLFEFERSYPEHLLLGEEEETVLKRDGNNSELWLTYRFGDVHVLVGPFKHHEDSDEDTGYAVYAYAVSDVAHNLELDYPTRRPHNISLEETQETLDYFYRQAHLPAAP